MIIVVIIVIMMIIMVVVIIMIIVIIVIIVHIVMIIAGGHQDGRHAGSCSLAIARSHFASLPPSLTLSHSLSLSLNSKTRNTSDSI